MKAEMGRRRDGGNAVVCLLQLKRSLGTQEALWSCPAPVLMYRHNVQPSDGFLIQVLIIPY
ncbi:hypothetical protein JZ751_000786 [Albula glossodonta]|uniref:Uncharacterized protein n=1 Tax=Albula glossodonta TaxID=121402 RepID=A0A8T2PWP7_9TELE|nr:hypothetical protein JZ751_000786 [Albula glossodonta]